MTLEPNIKPPIELVDLKQYCTQLTVAPSANEKDDYQDSSRFYVCDITQKPCIAKYIRDSTQKYDVFAYSRPNIDIELLDSCPAHNVSSDLAIILKKSVIQKTVSRLERQMGLSPEGGR